METKRDFHHHRKIESGEKEYADSLKEKEEISLDKWSAVKIF